MSQAEGECGPGRSGELELSQLRGQRKALGRTKGCVSAWEAALVALCRSTLARLEALEFILNQGFPKYGPGGALGPFRGSLGSKLFS